ncbi:MAG: beta-propeller fold lactonase family protein [Phycisphaerae bacterium]
MKAKLATVFMLLAPLASSGQSSDEGTAFPFYVGRSVCLECHSAGQPGGICTLRPMPKHDESLQAFTKPQAESIAALSGVFVPPVRSLICMDCHATGAELGSRWMRDTFKLEDGVQCEACHEPGSLHVDGYRAGTGSSWPIGKRRIRRGDRETCIPCHVERPSHREVLDHGFALSQADREYKTPVNLTVSPDGRRLYIACEHSDSLAVVDTLQGRLVNEIAVGRRPHDVALDPKRNVVYVSNRMSNSLSVVDVATGRVVADVHVGDEPHGVLVDPSGRRAFVLCTASNAVSVVDLAKMTEMRRLAAGTGPWSATLSADAATCYVTNVRPNPTRFRDPPQSEVTVIDVDRGIVVARHEVPGANMLQGVSVVPGRGVALFTLMRTKNLVPTTRLAQGWAITNGIGVIWPDGRVDQVLLDQPNDYLPDLMDIAVNPDGRTALVISGGSDQVAVVDVEAMLKTITAHSDRDRIAVLPNHLGMSSRFVQKRLRVGANPRAVVFAPDGRYAYVANALDDSLTVIRASDYTVVDTIELSGPTHVTQIRWGERLFHSADIAFARQFSCRSCHPDGHINGLTMDIEADGLGFHPVDNRSLRGVLDTGPFKWEGTNPSLQRQCGPRLAVFFTRLAPHTPEELSALVRYMCTIEQPPNGNRPPDGLTVPQRRGSVIFHRTVMNDGTPLKPEQQCAHCHSGAYKTSRTTTSVASTMWFDAPVRVELNDANMFDADEFGDMGTYYFIDAGMPSMEFDVPHLRNVYNSPPYLHNGNAATLEEIWTRLNMVNRHGRTQDLTRQQLNDLIEYIKAL